MKRQAGFTLVEIAIVLVIIGLLLGGVLKGQELIESAKVKNLAQDMRAISVAVMTYQDKYRALPGDDDNASKRWTASNGTAACAAGGGTLGNGIIEGNYDDAKEGTLSESGCVWDHLRHANLITGGVGDITPPRHADAGVFGVVTGSDEAPMKTQGTLVVCAINVRGSHVIPLDAMLDDGETGKGSLLAGAIDHDTLVATKASDIIPNETYTVCMGF